MATPTKANPNSRTQLIYQATIVVVLPDNHSIDYFLDHHGRYFEGCEKA
jgi:hypothetical protein